MQVMLEQCAGRRRTEQVWKDLHPIGQWLFGFCARSRCFGSRWENLSGSPRQCAECKTSTLPLRGPLLGPPLQTIRTILQLFRLCIRLANPDIAITVVHYIITVSGIFVPHPVLEFRSYMGIDLLAISPLDHWSSGSTPLIL